MTRRKQLTGERFNRWTILSDGDSIIIPGKKKRTIRILICRCDCGTIREVRHSNLVNGISTSCGCHHKEIAKQLMDKLRPTQVGERNPNWKGGITSENIKRTNKIRNTKEMRQWRSDILERDGECKKCGTIENLQAHHIDNFSSNEELRSDISNGICLCKECHHLFHKSFGFTNNSMEQIDEFLTY